MTKSGTYRTDLDMSPQEDNAQRKVAEHYEWLLARQLFDGSDSREVLERLGFKIDRTHDNLLYVVQPPKGWSKSTKGYWTSVLDEHRKKRLSQFYKGALHDTKAYIR